MKMVWSTNTCSTWIRSGKASFRFVNQFPDQIPGLLVEKDQGQILLFFVSDIKPELYPYAEVRNSRMVEIGKALNKIDPEDP